MGLALRGMFAPQQQNARSRDRAHEMKRIVSRQRQAEQAPGHGIATDFRRRRVAAQDVGCVTVQACQAPAARPDCMPLLISADQAGYRDQCDGDDRQAARIFLPHRDANQTDYRCGDMRPALPVTHLARRDMRQILKAQRAENQRQRAGAHHPCNLFITNHDGRKSFDDGAIRATNIADPRSLGKPHVLFKNLFKKKPAPARHELLKIDGRMLEVRVRLNPRARRMIVKVNPATGEVSVTAPSRRGLAHALDFARGEKDWIARQLARVPRPVALASGAIVLSKAPNASKSAAVGGQPAPVWRAGMASI